MDDATKQEMIRIAAEANSGNWLPLLTLTVAVGLILSLLLYIWNLHQKTNEKRHETNERILEKLVENETSSKLILEKVCATLEHHDQRIGKVEAKKT